MIRLWAGSEESWDMVLHAQQMVDEGIKAGRFSASSASDFPPIYQIQDGQAIVNIDGATVDGSAGFMRYFGVLGYDEIGQALIDVAMNPDVKSILMNINSPGGDVAGIVDMSKLIGQIGALKPMAGYTGKMMASAGYWMGSSIPGPVNAGPTAIIGSIGVLRVHSERSQQLTNDGVKTTIMRAGEHKALANPIEPLTEAAKAEIQQQLDDVHVMFKTTVAKNRPNMSADQLAEATTGKTYLGRRAVTSGLVDKISTLDETLKQLDKAKIVPNNPSKSKGQIMKITLSAEQQAKIASGVSIAEIGLTPEQVKAIADQNTADQKAQQEADAAKAKLEEDAAKAKAAETTTTTTTEVVMSAIDLLKSQLTAKDAELVTTKAELINLKASTQSANENSAGLLKIAQQATGQLQIALGNSSTTEAMDAATVIATHAKLNETFLSKFKVGGAAASTTVSDEAKPEDKATAELLSRLNAAKSK